MNEKNKVSPLPIRFLHPENELFVDGKTQVLAAPDEVKRNIWLQIQSGEVTTKWDVAFAVMLAIPSVGCGICMMLMFGCFAVDSLINPTASYKHSDLPWFTALCLIGGFLFLCGVSLDPLSWDYIRYIRPMKIDKIYTLFKPERVRIARIVSITPLSDAPYTHIAYIYSVRGRYRTFHLQGNYLAAQPIDLVIGDHVYIAIRIAKIIL